MRRLIVTLVLSISLLIPASTATAAAPTFEQRVVEIVNQTRSEAGLQPVVVSARLEASAEKYADQMATSGFFGHVSPNGSNLVTRNEAAGYTDWVYLGENLAAGQIDPQAAVNAWMKSPTHRANILSLNATEIGVGYVFTPGSRYSHYWVQEFGSR